MSLLKADVANLALGLLGSTLSISDVVLDTSAQAKVVRRHYSSSLQTLLERYAWGFAGKLQALSLLEESPEEGMYAFAYSQPSDALVILKVGAKSFLQDTEDHLDERNIFEELGAKILTNVGDAYARYTRLIDEGEAMPNHFGRALAAQLALDIAPSIITNNFAKVKNVLVTDAERRINDGIAADLNRKPRPVASDSRFVRVR